MVTGAQDCRQLVTIARQPCNNFETTNFIYRTKTIKRDTVRTLDVPSISERMVAPVALPATTIIHTPMGTKALGHVYRQVCREYFGRLPGRCVSDGLHLTIT